MSNKVLKLAGRRSMVLALFIMATLTLGLLFSGWFTPTPSKAQPNQPNPQPNQETTNCMVLSTSNTCASAGSISLVAPTDSPVVCIGSGVTLTATCLVVTGQLTQTITFTNGGNSGADACPDTVTNIPAPAPVSVTNWWEVTVGSFYTNGAGLTAQFNSTDCGGGSVTFHLKYKNSLPCDTNVQSAPDVRGSFQVDAVTALTPSAGQWVDDGDGDLNTDTYLVQYGCTASIIVTAADCLGLDASALPSCWQTTCTKGSATKIDNKTYSVDDNTVGTTVISVTCGTSHKTITLIVYKATYEADSAGGTSAAWWGHAWWDLSVTPSMDNYLTQKERTSQGVAGWYDSGDAQHHGQVRSGTQYIGGGSTPYVATGMYWWCVSFRNYVYALRYVDSLANGGSIFQDCNNNCVVQTKRVAFYAGVTLNYSGIECDNPGGLSAYLNDLLPSPPPCSCQ